MTWLAFIIMAVGVTLLYAAVTGKSPTSLLGKKKA